MDIYGDSSIFLKNSAEVLVIVLNATVHKKGRTIRKGPEEREKLTIGIGNASKDLERIWVV